MRIIHLSSEFYEKYKDCPEIMGKQSRPYCCLEIKIGERLYAIPFRHEIRHPYAFRTINNSGIDFSKAVVLEDKSMISPTLAWIEEREWDIIRTHERQIVSKFKGYLRLYEKAKNNPDVPKHKAILEYTTLKYFEETADRVPLPEKKHQTATGKDKKPKQEKDVEKGEL